MSRPAGSIVLLLLAACGGPAADPARARAEILAADRAFDSLVTAAGTRGGEAWGSFFGDSGKQVTPTGPHFVGAAGAGGRMGPYFADSSNRLRWTPEYAEVSEDGTLGFTIGSYRALALGPDGAEAVVRRGRYLSVWRKQADGSWKVAADIGNVAAPEESPE